MPQIQDNPTMTRRIPAVMPIVGLLVAEAGGVVDIEEVEGESGANVVGEVEVVL